jgi:hypothetical protein
VIVTCAKTTDAKDEGMKAWSIGHENRDGRYGKRWVCGRGQREKKMREKSSTNEHEEQ